MQHLQCRHHFDGAGLDKVDGGAMSCPLVILHPFLQLVTAPKKKELSHICSTERLQTKVAHVMFLYLAMLCREGLAPPEEISGALSALRVYIYIYRLEKSD